MQGSAGQHSFRTPEEITFEGAIIPSPPQAKQRHRKRSARALTPRTASRRAGMTERGNGGLAGLSQYLSSINTGWALLARTLGIEVCVAIIHIFAEHGDFDTLTKKFGMSLPYISVGALVLGTSYKWVQPKLLLLSDPSDRLAGASRDMLEALGLTTEATLEACDAPAWQVATVPVGAALVGSSLGYALIACKNKVFLPDHLTKELFIKQLLINAGNQLLEAYIKPLFTELFESRMGQEAGFALSATVVLLLQVAWFSFLLHSFERHTGKPVERSLEAELRAVAHEDSRGTPFLEAEYGISARAIAPEFTDSFERKAPSDNLRRATLFVANPVAEARRSQRQLELEEGKTA